MEGTGGNGVTSRNRNRESQQHGINTDPAAPAGGSPHSPTSSGGMAGAGRFVRGFGLPLSAERGARSRQYRLDFAAEPVRDLGGLTDAHVLERREVERHTVAFVRGLEEEDEAALVVVTERVSSLDVDVRAVAGKVADDDVRRLDRVVHVCVDRKRGALFRAHVDEREFDVVALLDVDQRPVKLLETQLGLAVGAVRRVLRRAMRPPGPAVVGSTTGPRTRTSRSDDGKRQWPISGT